MVAWTWPKYAVLVPLSLASAKFRKNKNSAETTSNEQIPQLGSKFCVPWKTVVPNMHHYFAKQGSEHTAAA